MPLPTVGDVHVNTPLTNILVANFNKETSFAAGAMLPLVPVEKQSNVFFSFDKGDMLRSEAKLRAPGTESAGTGFRLTATDPYHCAVRALHMDIADEMRANADAPLAPDEAAVRMLMQKMLLAREFDFVAKFLAASVWSGATDQQGVAAAPGANQFLQFNDASSDPVGVITRYVEEINRQTAASPEDMTLAVGPAVWRMLRNHAQFVTRIVYTQAGGAIVTEDLVAKVLGIKRVVVARATSNTAAEGAAASMAHIAGKKMLLAYTPSAPSLYEPSAGYTFAWTGLTGAVGPAGRVKKFRMEHLNSDRVEVEMAWDQKVVSADCGVYFYDVVA